MKYLKKFNESLDNIADICNEYGIINYIINDGLVDVDGDVDITNKSLTELPLRFGKITGDFNCSYNKLTSLEGAPKSVASFLCHGNQLVSLEGAPKSVGGNFYCSNNQLISLEGAPKSVGGNFDCYKNQLISLEGAPKSVGGNFYCISNQLTSLEGAPESVCGDFYCRSNNLVSLENCPPNIKMLRCDGNPIFKYWDGLKISDLELFLYMDINTTDPDEISEEKINYIKNK
jgi:hypothetical protein